MAWEKVGGGRLAQEFRRRAVYFLKSRGHEFKDDLRSVDLFRLLAPICGNTTVIPSKRREKYRFYIGMLPPAPKDKKQETSFYLSREWRELRYRALKLNGACCQCCGNRASADSPLHVDHIKPRSKFPELELELSNLQILCRDCNLGKSNKDQIDWRASFAACAQTGSAAKREYAQ